MRKEINPVKELMDLFDSSPVLVLYDKDLSTVEKNEKMEHILRSEEATQLNPIDVVLEALMNVISEKLSREILTHSGKTVLVNKQIKNLAVQEIVDIVKKNPGILREFHRSWLEKLAAFVSLLKTKGASKIEDIIFQTSMKFRISAISTIRAISSLAQ